MKSFRYVVGLMMVCLLAGECGVFAADSWQAAPGTRLVENGAVLENDLAAAGPVLQAAPLPAGALGRYRVTLRARTEKLGPSAASLQATARPASGGPAEVIASTSLSGAVFTAPGQWQEFRLEFEAEPEQTVETAVVYAPAAKQTNQAGKLQIESASITRERLDLPLTISYALSTKLRYKHGEPGELQVHLTNSGAQPQTVQVRPVVVDDTGTARPGATVAVTVPAGGVARGVVPFVVPTAEGGYELRAEALVDGKPVDSRSGDVFCVADSPFQCAIQSGGMWPYWLAGSGPLETFQREVMGKWDAYVASCREVLKQKRAAYCTYEEYFAWAREDATLMTASTDEPYMTGQTSYSVSRKQIRLLNGLMKSAGIAPVAYLNVSPFGWSGFEVMRRHPEWYDSSDFNTELLEKFENNDQGAYITYPHINVNLDARSANGGQTYFEYHLGQLQASAAMYGWEAYRYDAGPVPADHFPRVKAFLAKLNPPVAVGNNMGVYLLGNKPSADWTTYCRDGSYMMEEAIRSGFDSPTSPQRRWPEWIDLLRTGSHLTRSAGGHYTYINGVGNWLSTALGYAVGGHPWGTSASPYGDINRFMIRYGYYFWDRRTQLMDAPEKTVTVTSAHPLWWQSLVSERRLAPGHRQVIVPLFNPPTGPEVVDTTCEAPAAGVIVTLTPAAGEKVTAFLLTPEPVATRSVLPTPTSANGQVQVTVPTFWGWSNVVFDCEGK
ncbi:MAG TPA: hypothetical protein VGM19_00465 [Armatimonadota bacterium]|jgi:hypothetical protein